MKTRTGHRFWINVLILFWIFQGTAWAQEPIQLLVRADDMGITHDVNLGIIKAYKEGIVTSASLMPTAAYFEEAVNLCKENPGLAPGIHLTVLGTRQRPVLPPEEVPSLVTPQGFFYDDSKKLAKLQPDKEEIERELRAQIGKVRATGLKFVYLDWHRGVHQDVRDVVLKLCREQHLIYAQGIDGVLWGGYKRIKLQPAGVVTGYELPDGHLVHYAAEPYSEQTKQILFDLLENLEPGRWWSGTHPGMYMTKEDLTELLCDPRTLEIVKRRNIQLVSYRDLWEEKYGEANK